MRFEQLLSAPQSGLLTPHGLVDDALAAIGKQRQVLLSVVHFPLIPFVLRRTPCIANVPTAVAQFFSSEFGLHACKLPISSASFNVALLWHSRNDTDPALIWFKSLVRSVLHSCLPQNKTRPQL
jgi:LysR family transcriptional regulator, mexEF-oprN operon transcriptional activator